jgi:hypothetical protein
MNTHVVSSLPKMYLQQLKSTRAGLVFKRDWEFCTLNTVERVLQLWNELMYASTYYSFLLLILFYIKQWYNVPIQHRHDQTRWKRMESKEFILWLVWRWFKPKR